MIRDADSRTHGSHSAIDDADSDGSLSVVVTPQPDAAALFDEPEPIAFKGRNSIPKSHRGEGVNYVD